MKKVRRSTSLLIEKQKKITKMINYEIFLCHSLFDILFWHFMIKVFQPPFEKRKIFSKVKNS